MSRDMVDIDLTGMSLPRQKIPVYVLSAYRSGKGRDVSHNELYLEMIRGMGDGIELPTYAEFVEYMHLAHLQDLADSQLECIRLNQNKLAEAIISDEERGDIGYTIKQAQNKYMEISAILLKYADKVVDRATPKTVNVNNRVLSLEDIHDIMRDE